MFLWCTVCRNTVHPKKGTKLYSHQVLHLPSKKKRSLRVLVDQQTPIDLRRNLKPLKIDVNWRTIQMLHESNICDIRRLFSLKKVVFAQLFKAYKDLNNMMLSMSIQNTTLYLQADRNSLRKFCWGDSINVQTVKVNRLCNWNLLFK